MTKTQIYFPDEELAELRRAAKRNGKSVAEAVREAVRKVWLKPTSRGPVALWDGPTGQTAAEHDSIYDDR